MGELLDVGGWLMGACPKCSWEGRSIIHPGVTWCTRQMATVFVDWNACRVNDGICCHTLWSERSCSRPVIPGEGVILTDAECILAWGVVVSDRLIVEVPEPPPSMWSSDFWRAFWRWLAFLDDEVWKPPAAAGPQRHSGSEAEPAGAHDATWDEVGQ